MSVKTTLSGNNDVPSPIDLRDPADAARWAATAMAKLDFSAAMHALARERLGHLSQRVRVVQADFKKSDWTSGLSSYHAVVTMQAVHELRHKRHAAGFYKRVRPLLLPGGLFLVCDHVRGDRGVSNDSLFMSLDEHRHALREAGFSAHEVRHEGGLVLYRAQVARS